MRTDRQNGQNYRHEATEVDFGNLSKALIKTQCRRAGSKKEPNNTARTEIVKQVTLTRTTTKKGQTRRQCFSLAAVSGADCPVLYILSSSYTFARDVG